MLVCILFMIGTTNYVTPGCLQATGIVTPNEIVKTKTIPRHYKRQVVPWRRRVVTFKDTITFDYYQNWLNFDKHRNIAIRNPNKRGYESFARFINKANIKRYRFHLRMRSAR